MKIGGYTLPSRDDSENLAGRYLPTNGHCESGEVCARSAHTAHGPTGAGTIRRDATGPDRCGGRVRHREPGGGRGRGEGQETGRRPPRRNNGVSRRPSRPYRKRATHVVRRRRRKSSTSRRSCDIGRRGRKTARRLPVPLLMAALVPRCARTSAAALVRDRHSRTDAETRARRHETRTGGERHASAPKHRNEHRRAPRKRERRNDRPTWSRVAADETEKKKIFPCRRPRRRLRYRP